MATHSDGGKGSARRPGTGYEDGYDRIFGKKPRPEPTQQDKPADQAETNTQPANQ